MTFYSYRTGTSRGRDTYGYTIVSLTNTDTGKRYSTNGGGYDMLGSVVGDILNTEYQEKLIALHTLAEDFISPEKQSYQSRRAWEADGTYGRSSDYTKHYYGLTAYYDAVGTVKRVLLNGASGFSNCQRIAKAIGLSLTPVYDKNARYGWKLLGVEIKLLEGLDRACSEQALYYGRTLRGQEIASSNMAALCEAVTEGDE